MYSIKVFFQTLSLQTVFFQSVFGREAYVIIFLPWVFPPSLPAQSTHRIKTTMNLRRGQIWLCNNCILEIIPNCIFQTDFFPWIGEVEFDYYSVLVIIWFNVRVGKKIVLLKYVCQYGVSVLLINKGDRHKLGINELRSSWCVQMQWRNIGINAVDGYRDNQKINRLYWLSQALINHQFSFWRYSWQLGEGAEK